MWPARRVVQEGRGKIKFVGHKASFCEGNQFYHNDRRRK